MVLTGLVACDGGDDTPYVHGWPGDVVGPNEGVGWIDFTYPDDPSLIITEEFVEMGGTTFIPSTAACPGGLGPDYQVTWYNAANGQGGRTLYGLNCLVYVFAWWEVPLGMIPLEVGPNAITLTASDGLGNVGRYTRTFTRN